MKIPDFTGFTILIAEDNLQNAEYVQITLDKTGAVILSATNGEEAVELCSGHPEINLVLMDAMMPKMNGFDAARQIRKFNTSVPIIVLTAYVSTTTIHETVDAKCNDFLAKPIGPEELFMIIKKWLGKE
ncbi:MAG: response regulator [Bacteroidota bacterium]|jgi:CheY-like chemotaxis protein